MSAVCTLRRLFNNENLSADPDKSWKVFLAQKFNVDQSIRFTEKDGNSALLSGIWTTAYDTSAESTFKSQKGLIDLKRLCETEESKALYKIIEENRNAEIQLNSYIQKKEIIIPVSVTVRDTAGNVLLETEFPYSNEDGELINSENINILNEEVKDGGFSTGDLYISMKSAYQGERKVDRIAASLAENIEYGSGDDTKNSFGFASLTSSMVETAEDYGMIVVFKYSCTEMFIAWTVLLGLIMTGVMTLVVLLKKKKENEGF